MPKQKLVIAASSSFILLFSMMSNVATVPSTYENDVGDASIISSHLQESKGYLEVIANSEGHKQTLHIPSDQILFNITQIYDERGNVASLSLSLKPELDDFYKQVGMFDKPKDIVFIYPSFTQAAYGDHGFYDYYRKECDSSCLTVKIPHKVDGIGASSITGAWILKLLSYPHIKDEDVDKNPDILKQYKRVIVLHNEYVTKKEFDAITNHPNVIFLYPNALYSQVSTNYDDNTITLVRGHGYPDLSIKNGFDWKSDNSKYEYNLQCNNWHFYHSYNHTMLNCYPEYKILTSDLMLELLQKNEPTMLSDNIASWLMNPQNQNETQTLLGDFNVEGNTIPPWVQKPALLLLNGKITQGEFENIIQYLYQNRVIE